MSEFKVGDRVRVVGHPHEYVNGGVGVVTEAPAVWGYIRVQLEDWDRSDPPSTLFRAAELVQVGEREADQVNSPSHYTWLNGIEVIDITENLSFTLGNVVKYVLRADHKGKPIEDLKKAAWYLDREIQRREAKS